MPYCSGHTDNRGTLWEDTTQGCGTIIAIIEDVFPFIQSDGGIIRAQKVVFQSSHLQLFKYLIHFFSHLILVTSLDSHSEDSGQGTPSPQRLGITSVSQRHTHQTILKGRGFKGAEFWSFVVMLEAMLFFSKGFRFMEPGSADAESAFGVGLPSKLIFFESVRHIPFKHCALAT